MSSPPWPDDVLPELAARAAERPAVILDDDPTGTQTLRDVHVLTAWDADAVGRHLHEPAVFLSTNSRSLGEAAAVAISHDAAVTASGAARAARRPISIVSRGDSTLRGHFPAEPLAVAAAIGAADARILLAPFFGEGGRVTVGNVHYLEQDGARRPLDETEFARDPVFGYRSSDLGEWITEKYAAAGHATPPTTSLSLELVRAGGPQAVAEALVALEPGGVAIANADSDRDIEVVALGALMAEEAGLPLVARTAASYVRARAGRAPTPLLSPDEIGARGPGLIVVGSHVETTTRQLGALLDATPPDRIVTHELRVAPLLEGGPRTELAIAEAAATIDAGLRSGRTAIVSTERTRRDVGLDGGRAISAALVEVTRRIEQRPEWVVAKGGITSSDVASRGLGMSEARVAGQILPGVPVWVGGGESRWPGMPLVVFPGNVGGATALLGVFTVLGGAIQPS